jgi:hypothetical protein
VLGAAVQPPVDRRADDDQDSAEMSANTRPCNAYGAPRPAAAAAANPAENISSTHCR